MHYLDVICPDFSLSLANLDGSIRCTNKSQLNTIHESEEGISCPTLLSTTLPTCTIINGMELICNELGVMGSKVNLTQNMNRHNPMNV